jgi:hypothetical protein
MNELFVAWQSPTDRTWFTVGSLASNAGRYRFEYTRGAELAQSSGFTAFSAFPDLFVSYESDRLFPFFANRLLSPNRPEYSEFVRWVSHHEVIHEPVLLLGQSGGTRMTDTLELFPKPELDDKGHYHLHFFIHGLSHMPGSAAKRAEELVPGERLLIMKDLQNSSDPHALMLRTEGKHDRDIYFLGFFPRYLARDLSPVLDSAKWAPVQVLRVNRAPAPVQYRVKCCFQIHLPAGPRLFTGEEFMPMRVPAPELTPAARQIRRAS